MPGPMHATPRDLSIGYRLGLCFSLILLLMIGVAGSSVWIVNVSLRAPTAVGSKATCIVHVSELLAASKLLPPATFTVCDNWLLRMLTIRKFVAVCKPLPFCGTFSNDRAARLLSVTVWTV